MKIDQCEQVRVNWQTAAKISRFSNSTDQCGDN